MRIIVLGIWLLLFMVVPLAAQPSPLPPVNGEALSKETGYFNLLVDPAEYPGAKKGETVDVRLLSRIVAHGLVYGIDFQRVGTDQKIKIDERIYAIVRELELEEYAEYDGAVRFTYSYQYIVNDMDEKKLSRSIEGVGESKEKDMADAWKEARELAFVDAVENALKREYTDNQIAIPNEVIGMITTYEILYDDYSFTDKVYRFKVKAWVSFKPRENFIATG